MLQLSNFPARLAFSVTMILSSSFLSHVSGTLTKMKTAPTSHFSVTAPAAT